MSDAANSPVRRLRSAALGVALASFLLSPATTRAEETAPPSETPDLRKGAEEMSEAAQEAIERFVAMIGPMLENFEHWIDDMPRYEAPEVLPNGDIIIRRIPKDTQPRLDDAPESDVTEL